MCASMAALRIFSIGADGIGDRRRRLNETADDVSRHAVILLYSHGFPKGAAQMPHSSRPRSRASGSRTRSCCRRRRRPSRTATSCAPSTPAGAASSPRRSAFIRSSTSTVRRPSSCAPRADSAQLSMQKRPGADRFTRRGTGSSSPTRRSTGGCRSIARIKQAYPTHILVASIMAGSGSDEELAALADAGEGMPGRRRGRARAEPVVPAHGPQGHGIEHRQGHGADFGRDRSREGRRARAGLGEAHAVDDRHRRRGARRVSRRRRRDRLVQHVPVAPADRSRRRSNSR